MPSKAAYRAAEKLRDARTDEAPDYRHKRGVVHAELFNVGDLTREELWNLAELAEKRADARVGREVQVALPHELPPKARIRLVRALAGLLVERYGVAVDACIHEPHKGDRRNVHAHLLFTTRVVLRGDNLPKLGAKTRVLDRISTSTKEVQWMRASWERLVNQSLAEAGSTARIDMRSLLRRRRQPKPGMPPVRPITDKPHSLPLPAWHLEHRTGETSLVHAMFSFFHSVHLKLKNFAHVIIRRTTRQTNRGHSPIPRPMR